MPDSVAASEKTGGWPPNPEIAFAASESIFFSSFQARRSQRPEPEILILFFGVFAPRALAQTKNAKEKSPGAARPAAQF